MKVQNLVRAASMLLIFGGAQAADQPIIGLITKTESNPFFVKMKEGAEAEAAKLGAKIISAAGNVRRQRV